MDAMGHKFNILGESAKKGDLSERKKNSGLLRALEDEFC